MVRAAKRSRREEESTEVTDDPFRGEREQAVRVLRSVVLGELSTGRTEARVHIYKSFLFLVEKIRSFESVAAAKAQGYEYVMLPAKLDEELTVPVCIGGTIWGIAKSDVQPGNDKHIDAKNGELFKELVSQFQSLTVRLRYKRRVVRGKQSISEELPDDNGDVYWSVEENLSLHRVAMGMLVEIFKMKTYLTVLGSSGLSLRVVHVFAIALRGLIKKGVDIAPTALERSALGDVTFRVPDKDDDMASVMLGVRSDKGKDGTGVAAESATLDRARALKLEMSWNAYEVAKRKRAEEETGGGPSMRSSARKVSASRQVDPDDDFDVEWMADAGENLLFIS